MSVPVARDSSNSGLGIIDAGMPCETSHKDWNECSTRSWDAAWQSGYAGETEYLLPHTSTPRVSEYLTPRPGSKDQEPRSIPEARLPVAYQHSSYPSPTVPSFYEYANSPDIPFSDPTSLEPSLEKQTCTESIPESACMMQTANSAAYGATGSRSMARDQQHDLSPPDISKMNVGQDVSKPETQLAPKDSQLLARESCCQDSETVGEDLQGLNSFHEKRDLWDELPFNPSFGNEEENLNDIKNMVVSPDTDTLLSDAFAIKNAIDTAKDRHAPIKSQLRPIAIRSRSSAESFTRSPSGVESKPSHSASAQEHNSVGSPSFSMEIDDNISDGSPEYWTTEDVSEDGYESEAAQKTTMARIVDYLNSDRQFPHLSGDYRKCPHDETTERASGVTREGTLKKESRSPKGKKRVRERDQGQEEDDEDQKRRRPYERSSKPYFHGRSSRFACPFFQRTPLDYQNEVCTGPGFKDMKSLKEHFKRKHRLPLHCPRCWVACTSQRNFSAHMSSFNGCQPRAAPDGVTDTQWEQLHERQNFAFANTEEDRWRAIYRILWPEDHEIPSPYYEYYTSTRAVTEESSSTMSGATSNPGTIIADSLLRLFQARLELVSTLDIDSPFPRFEESGIPGAMDDYLSQLVGSRQQVPEPHTNPESTSAVASSHSRHLHLVAAPHLIVTTPASDTASSRAGPVTPMEEDPVLGAVEAGLSQAMGSDIPLQEIFNQTSRSHDGAANIAIEKFVFGLSNNDHTPAIEPTRQVPVLHVPGFEINDWIHMHEDASRNENSNEHAKNEEERVDSLMDTFKTWENGHSPIAWPEPVFPRNLSPPNAGDE